ncbi:MAG: hypothetical protein ACRDPE_23395 [Solirubrobacterales bacterium]
MKTRSLALLVAVAAATMALVAPASALAAETFSFGPGAVTFARLDATHGYRVNFSETEGGYFFVRVKGHGSTTDFATKTGHAPGARLRADFGKRGKFDLRFVPAGPSESLAISESCEGDKGVWQPGYLVGRARFRTERGFAQIRVHRVFAARESWSHQVCEFTGTGLQVGGHPKEKRATFAATAATYPKDAGLFASPERSLTFRATQFFRHAKPAARRVDYLAELRENAGRVTVHRKVLVAAPEHSLLFPGGPRLPEEIAVKPPAPFAGSAELLRTPESTFTWSGDLAVTFPGLAPIRLAGPRFSAEICTHKGCASRGAEDDTSGS